MQWIIKPKTAALDEVYETDGASLIKGAKPQGVTTEIIIEIKQLNSGRMASQASIESIWCTH